MSDDLSPVLALPLIQPAQAQKHVTHNEALRLLDVLVQPAVASRSTATPPPFPDQGARFILPAGATGAWAGQDHAIALHDAGAWVFLAPAPGWQAHVLDESRTAVFDGAAWATPADLAQRFPQLGVNADTDATNRLAVAAPATLFTHTGAGHHLKINKATAGDTASLLFQTGWSGRAELGTTGSDGFAVKLSSDGAAWVTALALDPASGLASGAAVAGAATDITAGRLLRVGAGPQQLSASPALRVAVGGSANAPTLTSGAGFTTLPAGLMLRFRAPAANTGAMTISLDGLAAAPCVTVTGAALPAGYVRTTAETVVTWDGSAWIVGRDTEYGTGAEGEFVRGAEGWQHCWAAVTLVYQSVSEMRGAWTFPAAFVAPPVAQYSISNPTSATPPVSHYSGSHVLPLSASAGLRQYRINGGTDFAPTDTLVVHATAIGRWY